MSTVVKLDWHIVCGSMEIEELSNRGLLKNKHTDGSRHSLFMMIKYPEHKFYQGGWGPELLHFVDDGPYRGKVGKVRCSYQRYKDIANWFLMTMFQP